MSLGRELFKGQDPTYSRVAGWLRARGWEGVQLSGQALLYRHETLHGGDVVAITDALIAQVVHDAEVELGFTDQPTTRRRRRSL